MRGKRWRRNCGRRINRLEMAAGIACGQWPCGTMYGATAVRNGDPILRSSRDNGKADRPPRESRRPANGMVKSRQKWHPTDDSSRKSVVPLTQE